MISTIFFDFFGVIVDIHGIDELADRAKVYGMTKEEITPYIKPHLRKFNRWEINTHEFRKYLSLDLNKPIPKYEEELFVNTIKNKVFLYPEMIDLIRNLRQNNYKCIVLSDVYRPDEEFVKQQWRYDCFDDKILSAEVWLSKCSAIVPDTPCRVDFWALNMNCFLNIAGTWIFAILSLLIFLLLYAKLAKLTANGGVNVFISFLWLFLYMSI